MNSPSPNAHPATPDAQPSSPMPHSLIPNPSTPHSPYTAYDLVHFQPLIQSPGGAHYLPLLPPELLTRQACLDRFTHMSTRNELVLFDFIERNATHGILSLPRDLDLFERTTQALWRLFAVRKSIFALEDNPSLPIPPDLEAKIDDSLAPLSPSPGSAADPAPPQPSSPSSSSSQSTSAAPAAAPASSSSVVPPSAGTSASSPFQHALASPTPGTADGPSALPSANTADPSSSPSDSQSQISNLKSQIPIPHPPFAPSIPGVPGVPVCPTLSPRRIEQYLNRTQADLSAIGPGQSSPASPSSNHPSTPSARSAFECGSHAAAFPRQPAAAAADPAISSLDSSNAQPASEQSQISNTKSQIPSCPKPQLPAGGACYLCHEPFCPSRISVPLEGRKCDGACRFCRPARTVKCPICVPRFRASP